MKWMAIILKLQTLNNPCELYLETKRNNKRRDNKQGWVTHSTTLYHSDRQSSESSALLHLLVWVCFLFLLKVYSGCLNQHLFCFQLQPFRRRVLILVMGFVIFSVKIVSMSQWAPRLQQWIKTTFFTSSVTLLVISLPFSSTTHPVS